MKIYRNDIPEEKQAFDELHLSGTAVALGQFDAIHIGHTQIIRKVIEYANANGLRSLVYMFSNDPAEVICGNGSKAVNSLSRRLEILDKLGVDIAVVQRFDKDFMALECDEFIENYLSKKLGAKFVAAGFNYRFGRYGEGNIDTLTEKCAQNGIAVGAVNEVKVDGNTVSSTAIRCKIEEGAVSAAAQMMGRYFTLDGIVERGNQIGRSQIGFPTANIAIPDGQVVPKFGVYISIARIDGTEYAAITNVGARPTVNEDKCCVETHIDGEFGDLYGRWLEIKFCEYIRGISKFNGIDELAAQLKKDKSLSKSFFEKINRKNESEN